MGEPTWSRVQGQWLDDDMQPLNPHATSYLDKQGVMYEWVDGNGWTRATLNGGGGSQGSILTNGPVSGTIYTGGGTMYVNGQLCTEGKFYFLNNGPHNAIIEMQKNVERPACTCGGAKANTTHSSWCDGSSK